MKKSLYHFGLGLAILLLGLITPSTSHAIIGTGIFDLSDFQLNGIEELSGPIMAWIVDILVYYIGIMLWLYISASALQWIISNPEWLKITGGPHEVTMVENGHELALGISNMFLLMIFIVVAFAFILKIESLQARKALPKLILVALLLNFSLLPVTMLVDIANIFMNTITQSENNLVEKVFSSILDNMMVTTAGVATYLATQAVINMIPFVAPIKQAWLVMSLTARGVFLVNLPMYLYQMGGAAILAVALDMFILLFAIRIYLIQILAIISPFAFLCLILPQTQKYWEKWIQAIVEWSFAGVFLLFFLVLGLNAGEYLLPSKSSPFSITGNLAMATINMPEYLRYYIFLFFYMIVVAYMQTKTMPIIAVALTDSVKSWTGKGMQNIVKPGAKAAQNSVHDRMLGFNDRMATARANPDQPVSRLSQAASKGSFLYQNAYHMATGKTLKKDQEERSDAFQKRLEERFGTDSKAVDKMMDSELFKSKGAMPWQGPVLQRLSAAQRVGMGNFAMKADGGSALNRLAARDQQGFNQMIGDQIALSETKILKKYVGHVPNVVDNPSLNQKLQDKLLPKGPNGEDHEEVQRMKSLNLSEERYGKPEDMALRSIGAKEVLKKREEIDNWDGKVFSDEKMAAAIAMNAKSSQIPAIAELQSPESVEKVADAWTKLGDSAVAANSQLARATVDVKAVKHLIPQPDRIAKQKSIEDKYTEIDNIVKEHTQQQSPRGGRVGLGEREYWNPSSQNWGDQDFGYGARNKPGERPPSGGGTGSSADTGSRVERAERPGSTTRIGGSTPISEAEEIPITRRRRARQTENDDVFQSRQEEQRQRTDGEETPRNQRRKKSRPGEVIGENEDIEKRDSY